MPDFAAVLLILATFGLMLLPLAILFARAHDRMDEIVTGVVKGVPVSKKYRWLLLFYDYCGYALTCVVLLGVFGTGYFRAADAAASEGIKTLAYFCGAACAWGAVAVIVFVTSWVVYMVALLRGDGKTK